MKNFGLLVILILFIFLGVLLLKKRTEKSRRIEKKKVRFSPYVEIFEFHNDENIAPLIDL